MERMLEAPSMKELTMTTETGDWGVPPEKPSNGGFLK